tara:strand:+ start:40 stop:726 length:687 start_codon:yes stop_codon:yes gene_type:complete
MNSPIFAQLLPKTEDPNSLEITKRKFFTPSAQISKDGINKARDFASKMTSKQIGEHRERRTGGSHFRSTKEIFINAFQGKLAEVAFYEYFKDKYLQINEPDFETYPKGQWDNFDFVINNKKINVKSTKHFGNLMLLEQGDWNNSAEYIPNIGSNNHIYDLFVLLRIDSRINNYDIPGFITRNDLMHIIQKQHIIKKGQMLNGKIPMDANNYYVQAGDMRNINTIRNFL